MTSGRRPTTLAFYLPQFHPTPENDMWWEPGFTEWFNVMRAEVQYEGQRSGRLPGALGFYDLRLRETRQAQIALARRSGIDGFMYYHYWFHGQRLLHEPLDRMLDSPDEDFPFCLCWANEPWSRRWDGLEHEVLMPQQYSPDDDLAHIAWLRGVFADRRYLRIDGRPLLFVYRPTLLPDIAATTERWRQACRAAGEPEPYLVKFDTYDDVAPPGPWGFDAAAEFVPHGAVAAMEAAGLPPRPDPHERENVLLDYEDLATAMLRRDDPPWRRFRCVSPNWDNTPRRSGGAATLTVGSTPERFGRWAAGAMQQADEAGHELLLFNSWNEWAEGANLEPDAVDGTAYLDALAAAMAPYANRRPAADVPAPRQPGPHDTLTRRQLRDRLAQAEGTLARRAVRIPLAIARRLRGS